MLVHVIEIAALAVLVAAPEGAAPLIGDSAPAFELHTLDGTMIGRDQLLGQITVVELFATWCLPCRRSLEDLRGIRAELGPDVSILVIAVERESAAVRNYFSRHPLPEGATVALDGGDSGRRWGKDRLPTTFFVDRAAVVRHINRGHGPGFRERATRWLRGMLTPPPAH